MSLHLKYIIQAAFYKEMKISACNFVKIWYFKLVRLKDIVLTSIEPFNFMAAQASGMILNDFNKKYLENSKRFFLG